MADQSRTSSQHLLMLLKMDWPRHADPEVVLEVSRRLLDLEEKAEAALRMRCSSCGDVATKSGFIRHRYGCKFATRDHGGPWPNMGEKL